MTTTAAAASSPKTYNVAIIGGGITGSSAAQTLLTSKQRHNINVKVDLFDQGRRGVGGRSSSRVQDDDIRWDHGCQFFRADQQRFKALVDCWIDKDLVKEWKGNFISSGSSSGSTSEDDFFGLPSLPPFYIGVDGMQNVPKGILDQIQSPALNVFEGTRVAQLERDEELKRWKLVGTSGTAAFHDTPEAIVKQSNEKVALGALEGYDAVILTDISSSFGKWHRASAGVPEEFAARVRERVGARVPLFTAMIAFDKSSDVPFDAATFDNSVLWFASKTSSKLDHKLGKDMKECWTLVSTPEYAMKKIEETPMQDPKTGDFIPQTKDYLTSIPGPDLYAAFCQELTSKNAILGGNALSQMPEIVYLDAQRWGSAMPSHRYLDKESKTRKIISGVSYDSGRAALAPTKLEKCRHGDDMTYLIDEDLMLLQAGDMMSSFTPGFEGAAISGMDAAERLLEKMSKENLTELKQFKY